MNKGMLFLLVGAGVAACGGAAQVQPTAPSTTTTTTNAEIAKAEPRQAEPAAEPAKPEPQQVEIQIPETTKQAEPCEARLWWSCITVSLDSKKIDKRATLLLGDPNIEETRSGTTDGRKTVDFTTSTGDTLSVMLRRKPGNKAEIVLKSGKGEMVIDRYDGDEFQYVSVIATEKAGKAYVDVRYMH